ncbi:hypothetical protein HI914_03389 [Erysiphe necator]|nr:hypothetical protein HI914_03389 [Erysiphe necator]
MLLIKDFAKVSLIMLICFQFIIGTLAYPTPENLRQESKRNNPNGVAGPPRKTRGGLAKPLIGGALIGGAAAIAYQHFRKDN